MNIRLVLTKLATTKSTFIFASNLGISQQVVSLEEP